MRRLRHNSRWCTLCWILICIILTPKRCTLAACRSTALSILYCIVLETLNFLLYTLMSHTRLTACTNAMCRRTRFKRRFHLLHLVVLSLINSHEALCQGHLTLHIVWQHFLRALLCQWMLLLIFFAHLGRLIMVVRSSTILRCECLGEPEHSFIFKGLWGVLI